MIGRDLFDLTGDKQAEEATHSVSENVERIVRSAFGAVPLGVEVFEYSRMVVSPRDESTQPSVDPTKEGE